MHVLHGSEILNIVTNLQRGNLKQYSKWQIISTLGMLVNIHLYLISFSTAAVSWSCQTVRSFKKHCQYEHITLDKFEPLCCVDTSPKGNTELEALFILKSDLEFSLEASCLSKVFLAKT